MSILRRKARRFIPITMLLSLLFAVYAEAQNKKQPQSTPMNNISSVDTGGNQGNPPQQRKRTVEKVGSIFDDQADEFEEPTYTPPADIEAKIKTIPKMPSNIKKYLKAKYHMKWEHNVDARLEQTPHGPKGTIWIHGGYGEGDLRPKIITEGTKEERVRGMARALIEEEASLFGIHNFEELRERKLYTDEYGTRLYFVRYIGGLLVENSDVQVSFTLNEELKHVMVQAVPISPEAYKAAARRTLGRGKIFRIIRDDLGGGGIADVKKIAIPNPPYVVWKVGVSTGDGDWDYKIDAFTGEILEKISATIPFKPRR